MMKRLRIWMIFLLVLLVPACSGNREKGEETTELRQQETDSREEKKGGREGRRDGWRERWR